MWHFGMADLWIGEKNLVGDCSGDFAAGADTSSTLASAGQCLRGTDGMALAMAASADVTDGRRDDQKTEPERGARRNGGNTFATSGQQEL